MEKVVKLDTENKDFLKKLKRADGKESKTYVLKLDATLLRSGYTEDGHKYVSFPKYPTIIVGQKFQNGLVVKYIDYIEDYGYLITFE